MLVTCIDKVMACSRKVIKLESEISIWRQKIPFRQDENSWDEKLSTALWYKVAVEIWVHPESRVKYI